jgi:UDP:flavonoid glycosyltransferase YjiC (YdhE family)
MKIGLQTWGSEGDIRPFLALAGGLQAKGHEVSLVVTSLENKDYNSYGEKLGFSVVRVGNFAYDEEAWCRIMKELKAARYSLSQMDTFLTHCFDPVVPEMYAAAEQLCRENDIIIGHFLHYPAQAAAEKAGKPYLTVALSHALIPSRHSRFFEMPDFGSLLNPLAWRAARFLINRIIGPHVNGFRKKAGLPPVTDILGSVMTSKLLNLVTGSAAISPRQPDWPDYQQVCGFLPVSDTAAEWDMPPGLKSFIGSGPPPVFITLGSMLSLEISPVPLTTLLVQAAELAGCRAIVHSRWDEMADFPDFPHIYKIRSAPHKDIFPFCAAVVHHGGAGTTHSATQHGCPSIVIEHYFDQAFFANELKRLGVAPEPLHKKNLTAGKLAAAIRGVLHSPDMKRKAEALSAQMQRESGVSMAVELIEKRVLAGVADEQKNRP